MLSMVSILYEKPYDRRRILELNILSAQLVIQPTKDYEFVEF